MARLNKPAYRWTVDQLRAAEPQSILEIGFGTGHLLALSAAQLKPERLAGRDPSDLMVETAQKRMKRHRKKVALDIEQGDDSNLPPGPFDAIVALHSFQFWAAPKATLTRLRSMLTPGGRLILVLRRGHSRRAARRLPNPLSREPNEIAAAISAAEAVGLTLVGMNGISKSSHGLIFACG